MRATPDHVYRLATGAEWKMTQETGLAPMREIDRKDGYFHMSTREQALQTANLHFHGETDLLALEIPFADVAEKVKFERAPKRGEDFPHLYDALRREHVARAIRLVASADGFAFGEAL